MGAVLVLLVGAVVLMKGGGLGGGKGGRGGGRGARGGGAGGGNAGRDAIGDAGYGAVYAGCIAKGGTPAECRRAAAYGRRASEYIHDAAPTIGGYLEKADPRNWNWSW